MNKKIYNEIKEKEFLIEEKRLAIKQIKQEKVKLHSKLDFTGNIYEYLAIPLCTISITLVNLFSGPIIYALPILTAVGAVFSIIYKYSIRKKLDRLNNKIDKLKIERKDAYYIREQTYEKVFNDLQVKDSDDKDYYHQILNASRECDKLTKLMVPYKNKKIKLVKVRNFISRIFDYLLAPFTTIALPLLCSFANVSTISEVSMIAVSSAFLLTSAITDEKLTEKVDELDRDINNLKSDRTVNYVKRDIKLNEALIFLESSKNIINKESDKHEMLIAR